MSTPESMTSSPARSPATPSSSSPPSTTSALWPRHQESPMPKASSVPRRMIRAMRHSRESEMTDPVARNRLAALLNDAAMAAWLDHLNPQAPWPMYSMLFVADYLLTAGVLPPH